MQISQVNVTACVTVTALAAATTAFAFSAASAAATAAVVAYAILALGSGAVTIAAITAWTSTNSNATSTKYFENVQHHCMVTIPCVATVVAKTALEALLAGMFEVIFERLTGHRSHTIRLL